MNKSYELYHLSSYDIFDSDVNGFEVSEDIRKKLAKDLGFSYDIYSTLRSLDPKSAHTLLDTMVRQSKRNDIIILHDESQVLGYTLDSSREPILNSEFLSKVQKIVSTSDAVKLDYIYQEPESLISTVIVKKTDPVIIEEEYENKPSRFIEYNVGVLLVNNEVEATTCRLVIYVGSQPTYLPAMNYSSSTTRYKRSTSDSLEALEVLLLKIISDLRDDVLNYKFQDIHYRYRYNNQIIATYEEYNSLLNTMRKMPSVIEDPSILDTLISLFEDFENKYHDLKDQKSSYLWRCTAIGEISIGALITKACRILEELQAPEIECMPVRDILGSYLSTPRIIEDIAKDSSV